MLFHFSTLQSFFLKEQYSFQSGNCASFLLQIYQYFLCVLCLVAQSCLTLCDPMDCSPQGLSVHGDSPGKNTELGCHSLIQGIFPTQELNLDLPHCRQILYHTRGIQLFPIWSANFFIQMFIGDSWLGMGLLIWCGNLFLETSKLKLRLPILCLDF